MPVPETKPYTFLIFVPKRAGGRHAVCDASRRALLTVQMSDPPDFYPTMLRLCVVLGQCLVAEGSARQPREFRTCSCLVPDH